jgi:hypothetical protein
MLKRNKSNTVKKNVRWRAINTVPPPPSPDMSVNTLVGHSTSFMLRQFIKLDPNGSGGVSPVIDVSAAEAAAALTRSLPNIQATEPEWPQPSPPTLKKRGSVDIPIVVLQGNDVRDSDQFGGRVIVNVNNQVKPQQDSHSQSQVVPQQKEDGK